MGTHAFAAPAKLNLTLNVLGRRPDGYHALESLIAFALDATDKVTLTPGMDPSVRFTGPFATGLDARKNTVSDTLRLVSDQFPDLQQGQVVVEKNIPRAGGLGGGSADAGALLRALQHCNKVRFSNADCHAIARQVGADVPVCFVSTVQMVSGVGETLQPVPRFPSLYVVLINSKAPELSDKTRRVFEALEASQLSVATTQRSGVQPPLFKTPEDVVSYMRDNGNDLLTPARHLMPALEAPLATLQAMGPCLAASVSGAGPTVFGVFATRDKADAAARAILTNEPDWWVMVSALGSLLETNDPSRSGL